MEEDDNNPEPPGTNVEAMETTTAANMAEPLTYTTDQALRMMKEGITNVAALAAAIDHPILVPSALPKKKSSYKDHGGFQKSLVVTIHLQAMCTSELPQVIHLQQWSRPCLP